MTSIIVTTRNLTAPARRASSLGVVSAFAYIGHGLGGWQGGHMFDLTGNYHWTYANAAIAGIVNLVIVASLWFTIHRRPALQPQA
jgi:predicted MFS family arabinose efflux permease